MRGQAPEGAVMTTEVQAAARASEDPIVITRRELVSLVEDAAEEAGLRAARRALQEVGLSISDETRREEMRADLTHLRKWRRAFDRAAVTVGTALLIVVVGGLGSVLWLGFKLHILKEPP
ncbi:hypothetical protein ACT6QG_02280 [Xanthobacter sp. TB0136]|uniref:hypothetical protein n=1 Tax=Xanthobacter sp. TB0136 TaxID=3459177 RepID=UPI00403A4926